MCEIGSQTYLVNEHLAFLIKNVNKLRHTTGYTAAHHYISEKYLDTLRQLCYTEVDLPNITPFKEETSSRRKPAAEEEAPISPAQRIKENRGRSVPLPEEAKTGEDEEGILGLGQLLEQAQGTPVAQAALEEPISPAQRIEENRGRSVPLPEEAKTGEDEEGVLGLGQLLEQAQGTPVAQAALEEPISSAQKIKANRVAREEVQAEKEVAEADPLGLYKDVKN